MTRIEKLISLLPDGCDGAIVATHSNRAYLTGLLSSAGTLLVSKKGAWFIIDSRYIEVAKKTVKGAEVILQSRRLGDQLAEICKDNGIKSLLCEQQLTLAEFGGFKKALEGVNLISDSTLSDLLAAERAIKDEGEVAAIKAAQAITDGAFSDILKFIKVGVSEKEIATELEYRMRLRGADGFAFETIVVSGENSSMPHGVPGERRVQNGDFITMDFGAFKNGYCSDMTRTVAVGEISDEQKKVYDTVLKAHLESAAAAKAGMTGKQVDAIARDIIYSAGYEGCFGHSLGHAVGMEVHEAPMCSPSYDLPLPAGTVMTIEPGIYIEGKFGVRIENMILIGEDGSENLTASERELIVL